MADYVEFNGFKHYPTGDAYIKLENGALVVSGLADVRDGLTIDTKGSSDWKLRLQPVTIEGNTFVGSTFNILDGRKRAKTIAQWTILQSPDSKYAYLVVNGKLEGEEIILAGMKGGKEVFGRTYYKPDARESNWIIVAVFVLAAAPVTLSAVNYKTIMERDGQNRVIKTTTTKSLGGIGIVSPGSGKAALFSIMPTGQEELYEVDYLNITSSFCYPAGLAKEQEGHISQVILTGHINPFILVKENRN